jgi:hypothetical protein
MTAKSRTLTRPAGRPVRHATKCVPFPDLHDAFDADELPVSFIVRRDARRARAKAVRRQKPMSAAAKRAVSQRMKKYWTDRRTGHKT